MGRKRGFFAELQHQQKLVEQQHRREQAAAQRAHVAAVKHADKTRRDAERAQQTFERALEKDRKQAEKEAAAHFKSQMIAQADAETARYSNIYDEIDSVLESTLEIDDYIDLASLKIEANNPEFNAGDLAKPLSSPRLLDPPREPTWPPIPEDSWWQKIFVLKATREAEKERILKERADEIKQWKKEVSVSIPAKNQHRLNEHKQAENRRLAALAKALKQHQAECAARDAEVNQHNKKVDEFIERFESGDIEAVNEYIGIVLANSVYPDSFPVDHDFQFDGELKELNISVTVLDPSTIPIVKQVKYIASSKELKSSELPKTEQKKRYNNAVFSVALRTLHEIFEADRANYIDSISLVVHTEAVDPATGHLKRIPFVYAAAEKSAFMKLKLSHVDAAAALEGINATLSKNPFILSPAPNAGFEARL